MIIFPNKIETQLVFCESAPKLKFGYNIAGSGGTLISCCETIFVSSSMGRMGLPDLVMEVPAIMFFPFHVSNFPFFPFCSASFWCPD